MPTDDRRIQARRITFRYDEEPFPKYFVDDNIAMSHFTAVLSGLFPDGEDFFVESVREQRAKITDPELKRAVAGFIGQEAIHGREHRQLNDRLAELGYPTKKIEAFTTFIFDNPMPFEPALWGLANTAALEHFTATFAETLMGRHELRDTLTTPEVLNTLLWHALEESEHKAVAFDVYRHVGGSERLRRVAMNMTIVGFLGVCVIATTLSVIGDREARRQPRRVWRDLRAMLRTPLFERGTWDRLRDYNRADFHPDDHDAEALVAEWRERLFGEAGELNDRLAG